MFNLNNLKITPSWLITVAILTVLSSGLIILHYTNMPFYLYAGMFVVGTMFAALFILHDAMLLLPKSIVRCDADEHSLYFTKKSGERIKVHPTRNTFMSAHLLILGWKPATTSNAPSLTQWPRTLNPARCVILTSTNVSSKEDFRRLRVLLKFGKLAQSTTNTDTSAS